MIVGVPKETKEHEYRIALLPVGAEELTRAGHTVLVEQGAGVGSGIPDAHYASCGAQIVNANQIWSGADLVVKVKEPQPSEVPLIREGQLVFTFFHFAAFESLTRGFITSGATAIAYETLEAAGALPLLTPMSEVAGRMSIQQGAKCLERPSGGRGVLLGGVPGVAPARVTIIGGGVVGTNAAKMAAGLGADVVILDKSLTRLRYLDDVMPANVKMVYSDRHTIVEELKAADMVVGAVLIPGARAPKLITRDDLKLMKAGAVIVDVAVDQGGMAETTKPTTHGNPTFVVDGVVHYCVANIPGAVSRTSTYALCNATFPVALELANRGLEGACAADPRIVSAVNIHQGVVTHPAVAEAFGLEFRPFTP